MDPLPDAVASDARDLLAAALDASPDGFAIHRVRRGPDGAVTGFTLDHVNAAGAAPFTDLPVALVGRDVAGLLGPSAGQMLEAFRRTADTGEVQRVRTTFSGSPAAGTTESVVVRVDAERLVSTWRDITEQLVEEQLLAESLRQAHEDLGVLRTVLDALEDAVVLLEVPARLDLDTGAAAVRLLWANASAASALGTTPARAAGRRLVDLVDLVAAHVLAELAWRALHERRPCTERLASVDDAGTVQDAREVTACPAGGGRVVLQSRDVTREEWER